MSFAHAAQQALILSVLVGLPALLVAALVGLVVASLQAATQIQDQTLAHVPRLLAVAVVLAAAAPWMGQIIVRFAREMFLLAAI